MEKSLWAINFISNSRSFGSGVVIIDGNQITGGDGGYYYIGNCIFTGNTITASAVITKHNSQVISIFGDLPSINLSLSGTVNGNEIQLSGHITEIPQMTMQATMRKLTTLV